MIHRDLDILKRTRFLMKPRRKEAGHYAAFAARVKRVRENLGMTQEQFAAAADIPVQTLRSWEQGEKLARYDGIIKLETMERRHEKASHGSR